MDQILSSIYYTSNHPSSFSSIQKLYTDARIIDSGITKKYVKDWLSKQLTYTLHRPARRTFKRNRVLVSEIDEEFQADLVDLREFKKVNSGYAYLLTVIDVLSKFAFAVPLKTKTKEEVANALESVLKIRVPVKIRTDAGTEFLNKNVKQLLLRYKVYHSVAVNPAIKCSVIERFNRTLKDKMFKYFTKTGKRRYIGVLDDLLISYNSAEHSSIKLRPVDVTRKNQNQAFENLYKKQSMRNMLKPPAIKALLKIGNKVRLKYILGAFERGYYPNWTDEVFVIHKIIPSFPKTIYKIANHLGVVEAQRYYADDLQAIKDEVYRIEKVLKERTYKKKQEVFVKWLNYSSEHNSWIPKSDVVSM